jgi:hypothetical protein
VTTYAWQKDEDENPLKIEKVSDEKKFCVRDRQKLKFDLNETRLENK